MTDILPPQNIESEQALLGAMLMSTRAIEAAIDARITPADFHAPSHRSIFAEILELHGDNYQVDWITVADALKRRGGGALVECGGKVALLTLTERAPAVSNAKAYAASIRESAIRRRLYDAGHGIASLGQNAMISVEDATNQAAEMVAGVASSATDDGFAPADAYFGVLYDEWVERHAAGRKLVGLSTGYPTVDRLLGGLRPGTLTVLAARPGMGKTSFALNISENVAFSGAHVGFVSLEMTRGELISRLIAGLASIDAKRLTSTIPTDADFPLIVSAMDRVSKKAHNNILIDDSPSATPLTLRTKLRRLHAKLKRDAGRGVGLLVLDYIQLMEASKRFDNRQLEVASFSRSLKALGKELNIPVLALSQLSRELEKRNEKIPQLSDLRDSGAIEQDADAVVFLHRPEYFNPDDSPGMARVIVAKNRQGAIGDTLLRFQPEHTRFLTPIGAA